MPRTLIGEGNAIVANCRTPVSCQRYPTAFTVGAERDEVLYRWADPPKFRLGKSVGITRTKKLLPTWRQFCAPNPPEYSLLPWEVKNRDNRSDVMQEG